MGDIFMLQVVGPLGAALSDTAHSSGWVTRHGHDPASCDILRILMEDYVAFDCVQLRGQPVSHP